MNARHFLLLIGCLIGAGCTDRSQPITIGVAGPWTDWSGDMMKKGVELAVADINDSGGVRGRKLVVLERDDQHDGAHAAAVAQGFVANPLVVGVVGHVTSGAMVAAAKVYDGHLVAIATSATSPDLTGISPWTFRVISSDSSNGITIARFATTLGKKRAAIIYENDSYGRGLADAFRRNFHGEIVSMDPIGADIANAEPYITLYKRLQPDIVFVIGLQHSGQVVLREARRQHLAVAFIGGDGWSAIASDTALSEGVYVGTPFTAENPRPDVQRFVAAFRSRYGLTPDLNAALGYDATRVLAGAIASAGTGRAAIRKRLASLTDATAYHGLTGVIRFRPDGDPVNAPYRVTRVHDGAFLLAAGQ